MTWIDEEANPPSLASETTPTADELREALDVARGLRISPRAYRLIEWLFDNIPSLLADRDRVDATLTLLAVWYERDGPQDRAGLVQPERYAALTAAHIDAMWDFEHRHIMHRVAKVLAARLRAERTEGADAK